jgi:hypothetical protein
MEPAVMCEQGLKRSVPSGGFEGGSKFRDPPRLLSVLDASCSAQRADRQTFKEKHIAMPKRDVTSAPHEITSRGCAPVK